MWHSLDSLPCGVANIINMQKQACKGNQMLGESEVQILGLQHCIKGIDPDPIHFIVHFDNLILVATRHQKAKLTSFDQILCPVWRACAAAGLCILRALTQWVSSVTTLCVWLCSTLLCPYPCPALWPPHLTSHRLMGQGTMTVLLETSRVLFAIYTRSRSSGSLNELRELGKQILL